MAMSKSKAAIHDHDTARLYQCARCRAQTVICRCCDRGNLYCPECALPAYQDARRRASRRYQNSQQGRLKHAARQRRYRERQAAKVTHSGSPETKSHLSHSAERNLAENPPVPIKRVPNSAIICRFCAAVCSAFLRLQRLLRPG